jgi:hypothetical protein
MKFTQKRRIFRNYQDLEEFFRILKKSEGYETSKNLRHFRNFSSYFLNYRSFWVSKWNLDIFRQNYNFQAILKNSSISFSYNVLPFLKKSPLSYNKKIRKLENKDGYMLLGLDDLLMSYPFFRYLRSFFYQISNLNFQLWKFIEISRDHWTLSFYER